jgi:DNA-binding NtrC family response regulator
MAAKKILIIDDEPAVRNVFSRFLKGEGFSVTESSGGKEALSILAKEVPDVILLDLKMPEMDGISVLKEIMKTASEIPVIMITAYGDVPVAVEATKLGAYDFLCKPTDLDNLVMVINRAVEKRRLNQEIWQLDKSLSSSLEMLLGRSSAIKKVIEDIRRVASSDFSLIMEGETGTGKTFIASIIHNLSGRAKGPFVTLDVSAIPETLIESELFGYEKGAFTGAEKRKKGYFELADKGTIFIDELQNITPLVQSKLLKVVEERRFHSIGSNSPVETNVRIIGATNKNMVQSVKDQLFREDLYYRLNEFIIHLPPLRERAADIPFLAQVFLTEVSSDLNKYIPLISDDAINVLMKQPWNGNVRELKNVIRKSALLCDNNEVTMDIVNQVIGELRNITGAAENKVPAWQSHGPAISLNEAEKIAIRLALEQTGGNKTKAAEILQVTLKTLLKKIRDYGI